MPPPSPVVPSPTPPTPPTPPAPPVPPTVGAPKPPAPPVPPTSVRPVAQQGAFTIPLPPKPPTMGGVSAPPVPPTGRAATTVPLNAPVKPIPPSAPLKPSAAVKPSASPTLSMPTATIPLGGIKPGIAKPTTFNKQKDVAESNVEKKESPLYLTISIVAAILSLACCIILLKTGATPNRVAPISTLSSIFAESDGATAGATAEDSGDSDDSESDEEE